MDGLQLKNNWGKSMSEETLYTLEECGNYGKVTRQAVYLAIRKNKLKATKVKGKWMISPKDYDEYRLNKFNRSSFKYNGEYIYDMDKGHFSVQQVCKIFTHTLKRPFSQNRLYYLLHAGKLKGFRKRAAWVICKEDAVALLDKLRGVDDNQLKFV